MATDPNPLRTIIGEDNWQQVERIREQAGDEAAEAEARRIADELMSISSSPAVEDADVPPPPPGQHLAKREPVQIVAGEGGYIRPSSFDEAARLGRAVITAGYAPESFNNDVGKVTLALMTAMEAGIPPLLGLRNIAIINGRPCMWGDLLMALVQSKNLLAGYKREKIGTPPKPGMELADWPDDYGYRVSLRRRHIDGEFEGEFTVGDARRGKLWLNAKKVPWLQYPDRMLFNRARAFSIRDGFADALGGIAVREEVEDYTSPVDGGELRRADTSALDDDPVTEAAKAPPADALDKDF